MAVIATSSLFTITSCIAQQKAKVTFDVSSVKPAQDNSSQGYIRRLDAGIVSVSSMTLNDMIELFYHVRPYQVLSTSDWIKKDRFDVTGKDSTVSGTGQRPTGEAWSAALDADDEQMRELLKDRFSLRLHHETRALPALMLLTVGRKHFDAVPCSSDYKLQHGIVKGSIRMASLASLLKVELGMPVRDGSGLNGCYYMDAHWTTNPNDESLPQLVTALHDLGMRLEKTKTNTDVIVIDHLERPRAD